MASGRIPAPHHRPTCGPECPVRRAAGILDGKWTILLIRDLLPGPRRYFELKRSLDGISPRMLASRLRFLEAYGIVHRKVFPTVPPQTEYTLTDLGRRLEPVISAMGKFGRRLG